MSLLKVYSVGDRLFVSLKANFNFEEYYKSLSFEDKIKYREFKNATTRLLRTVPLNFNYTYGIYKYTFWNGVNVIGGFYTDPVEELKVLFKLDDSVNIAQAINARSYTREPIWNDLDV